MRIVVYGGVSTLSATSAVLAAFRQRANFYAAAVYLSKSNACMMILCNFGIFCTILLAKFLQSIFFGQLRLAEIERLHDRLWFTISETLLALAMFRDEFDTSFVVLFISLIFVKCFHWLAADRVDWMDQAPTPPGKLFHARMVSILSIIWLTDMLLIAYATESVLLHGPSVVLMFEMEYIIMQVTCLSIICKYILNSYSHYRAQEHWEGKSTYQFYIDLATDFLKLITYIGFLSLTLTFHALPINVLRDVYYTFRSFVSKCNNLVRFRQATRNMNERYPNATREEMEALVDKTCIICREEMEYREDPQAQRGHPAQNNNTNNNNNNAAATVGPNDTPKKLTCGHVFHFHCLRSWLERQQTCPTCRRPVIQAQAAPQAAPQNPNAAANRAFAAAMAAAGVGAPPAPPAPPAGGRGGGPPVQQAQPPPADTGDGNLPPRPDGTRPDFHQRLREYQQRLAAPPLGPNGAPATTPLESGPQNPSNVLRLTGSNPLVSFDISAVSATTSARSSALPPTDPNNSKQTGSSSQRPSLGFSKFSYATKSSNSHDTPKPSLDSSKPQVGTSQDQSTHATQAASSSEALELPLNEPQDGHSPNVTSDVKRKKSMPSFKPSATTTEIDPQHPAAESLPKPDASLVDDRLTDNRLDSAIWKLRTDPQTRLPCLIPLFDPAEEALGARAPASSQGPIGPSGLDRQLILNQYSESIQQLQQMSIVSGPEAADTRLSVRSQAAQLLDIQHRLMECCAQLASIVGHQPPPRPSESTLRRLPPHPAPSLDPLPNSKGKNKSEES